MTCDWKLDESGLSSVYETQCGHSFALDDRGSPKDHELAHCPFCGGELIDVSERPDADGPRD